jgi:Na+/phosphate symporter
MAEEQFVEEQVAVLGPVVDKLLTMMGAARDAFNRHSLVSLEELQNLQKALVQDIEALTRQIQPLVARKPEPERAVLLRLLSVLHHLEIIGESLEGLTEPIRRKIQEAVLFSDKAVTQSNYLFDQHAGMIRSLLDIIKTDNDFLKKYVLEEGGKLVQASLDYATEHEDRMIEGLCLPQAAPIFLSLLDTMRTIGQHEMDIAQLLAKKS